MEKYSEMIWKIQKKILKRYGKYETKVEYTRDLDNTGENSEKIGKIWTKIVK